MAGIYIQMVLQQDIDHWVRLQFIELDWSNAEVVIRLQTNHAISFN